jgi:hypothetical protein
MHTDANLAIAAFLLTGAELHAVSGGTRTGIPHFDPESGEYIVVPYVGWGPALYVEIGGRWVPTGSEPFIPPKL